MKKEIMENTKNNFEMKEEYNFSKGVRGRFYKPHKKSTTIRLDNDIILYFKKLSSEKKIGYQILMNLALQDYIYDKMNSSKTTTNMV